MTNENTQGNEARVAKANFTLLGIGVLNQDFWVNQDSIKELTYYPPSHYDFLHGGTSFQSFHRKNICFKLRVDSLNSSYPTSKGKFTMKKDGTGTSYQLYVQRENESSASASASSIYLVAGETLYMIAGEENSVAVDQELRYVLYLEEEFIVQTPYMNCL